jgi:predicted ATPase
VQLFVERAMASQDDFELTDATAPVVVDICRKVDGLPLAIELAAALVGLFGIREVGSRIDDPLGLLTKGCRTAPLRHQTLRATLDWSYTTLSESERIALHRLAIFDRSFDLNSAVMELASDTIAPADVADIIANLTAKSLLVRDEAAGRDLYRLLTTTRAYALEKLMEPRQSPGSDQPKTSFRSGSEFADASRRRQPWPAASSSVIDRLV